MKTTFALTDKFSLLIYCKLKWMQFLILIIPSFECIATSFDVIASKTLQSVIVYATSPLYD